MNNSVFTPYIKPVALILASIVVVEFGVHFANRLIVGGTPIAALSSNQLPNTVSHSIGTGQVNGGTFPSIGKDYDIKSVQYFLSNNWAVVTLSSTTNNNDTLEIVQEQNGNFKTVVGPGSMLLQSSIPSSVPTQVQFYLYSHGLITSSQQESLTDVSSTTAD